MVNAVKRAEQDKTGRGGDGGGLSADERDELRRLRSKVAELELEKVILRKAAASFAREMGSMIHRYRFISEHRAVHGVTRLCRVLAIPRRQGFSEWLAAQPARPHRAATDDELTAQIRAIHAEHQGRYGSPRVTDELRRRGHLVNRKRVERLMRQCRIAGITRRRRRSLTRPDHAATPAPD